MQRVRREFAKVQLCKSTYRCRACGYECSRAEFLYPDAHKRDASHHAFLQDPSSSFGLSDEQIVSDLKEIHPAAESTPSSIAASPDNPDEVRNQLNAGGMPTNLALQTCDEHRDAVSIGTCYYCSKRVCSKCGYALDGMVYCNSHHQIPSERATRLSWSERHLNWTLFLVNDVVAAAASICLHIPGASLLAYFLYLAVMIPICLWYLRRKGRSLFHVLWLLLCPFGIPVGLIVLLLLENRR